MRPPTPVDPRAVLGSYYSDAAVHYARSWAPVLTPLGETLVRELSLARARVVVDAGAGTGSLLAMLKRRAPEALVLGADLSEGMLREARSKHADLAVMDAQSLALASDRVDAIVFAFMLFHVPAPSRALGEAWRTLRTGGEVGIATWADDRLPGSEVWTEELDALGASADPMPPQVQRHDEVDSESKLTGLLRAARLTPLRAWTASFEHGWTFEGLLDTRIHCGGHGRRLRSLAPEARAQCVERVRARLEPWTPAELVQRMRAVFAVGTKED